MFFFVAMAHDDYGFIKLVIDCLMFAEKNIIIWFHYANNDMAGIK